MAEQWTKGTAVSLAIAAGRSSPTKQYPNGIQGGHAIQEASGTSPQSRYAQVAKPYQMVNHSSSRKGLTEEWITSHRE